MSDELLKQKYDALVETLNKINKIATDARNGAHPADWRKDWQRNEWTKVRDLSNLDVQS